jgi:NAD(P)H-dependent flavin oxidoreductase YrpB (nitropropane dioxygenase family)
MDRRVLELWRSEVPIQLAPMGSVSATPRLALAAAAAGASGSRARPCWRCSLYAGQSAGAIREVRPAAEIVAELAAGVSAATRA